MNLKLQNMKQAAYFDYFKSFSLNASDTIRKLQHEFKEQIEESFFLDTSMMFKRVKTLLGSYEILIYQINDSCEFVQIPEFGNCILKIFLQIMSVIRFLLHKIVEKTSTKPEPSPFIERTNSYQKTHIAHSHISHSASLHQQNRLMYKKKEQSKYIISTLNQELSLLELEQSQNSQVSKKQFRSLIQGKEKLQSIQISQNQNILSEALNSFCKKGQHLKNFVNVRQAAMISNMKEGVGQYIKVKDIFDEDSITKLQNASIKLQELFKTHTINYLKEKQSQMVSQPVQVKIEEPMQGKILEENKHIKKLNDALKKLADQIGFEQQKNQSLETLLKSKNDQFEQKAMEFRVAKIQMENIKIKHQKILETQLNLLNSKHDLCSNCNTKMSSSVGRKKSEGDCISKSIIEAEDENERDHTQQSERKSQSAIQNPSKLMEKFNKKFHHKNSSSVNRKNLSYKKVSSKSNQFQIDSLTWQLKISPPIPILQRPQSKKRQLQQKIASTNGAMNNTFSTSKDHEKMTLIASRSQLKIQRVFAIECIQGRGKVEYQLIGIKGWSKKNIEESSPNIESMSKQVTEKWIKNDQVHSSVSDNHKDNTAINMAFSNKNLKTEIVDSGDQNFDNKLQHSISQKNTKDKPKPIQGRSNQNDHHKPAALFKKVKSQTYKNLQRSLEKNLTNNQDEPLNSVSRISCKPNNFKFPRFIKFLSNQKITLTMKQLINLFFNTQTAKNFEYIHLFQNDDLKVGTTAKDIRKNNLALTANIKQMQKKNFINGLITKVKGEVAARDANITSPPKLQTVKNQRYNEINEYPSNSNLSESMIKTQFRNQISVEKKNNHDHDKHQTLKIYNFQTLVALLFKQLSDLKRYSPPSTLQMTNYEIVRNFLRYPFSAIALKNDRTFLEKQRQDSGIEYLELRKIMHRVFKLHKNCKMRDCKNSFENFGMKQLWNGQRPSVEANDNQNLLCLHLVAFFQTVGILLQPKQGQNADQN